MWDAWCLLGDWCLVRIFIDLYVWRVGGWVGVWRVGGWVGVWRVGGRHMLHKLTAWLSTPCASSAAAVPVRHLTSMARGAVAANSTTICQPAALTAGAKHPFNGTDGWSQTHLNGTQQPPTVLLFLCRPSYATVAALPHTAYTADHTTSLPQPCNISKQHTAHRTKHMLANLRSSTRAIPAVSMGPAWGQHGASMGSAWGQHGSAWVSIAPAS